MSRTSKITALYERLSRDDDLFWQVKFNYQSKEILGRLCP